jgi:L,D-transpeptidase YcbB
LVQLVLACGLLAGPFGNAGLAQNPGATPAAVAPHIARLLETLSATGELTVEERSIGTPAFMAAFYGARDFTPAWTEAANGDDLVAAVTDARSDGLMPEDFHASALSRLRASSGLATAELARRDILMTDALVRLGYQLYYGKVDPSKLDASWNLERPLFDGDPVKILTDTLQGNAIADLLSSLRPQMTAYEKLRAALAAARSATGRPQVTITDGPTLRLGDTGERVVALRRRLGLSEGATFDEALDAAIRAFQEAHYLEVDGLVGGQTRFALNMGAEERVDILRVNLERARWFRDLQQVGTLVAVNIAGFRVYFVRDGAITWQSRAIVGDLFHKTPLFKADLRYLVFNPTWTPTDSIVRKEMLPRILEDPDYLTDRNFLVFESSGEAVDPHQADWSRYHRYRIVQQAGPDNALGQVKFIFPNEHSVYLHDTPGRNLFNKSRRAFSHGCIRIENPLALAEHILAGDEAWQPEAIAAVLEEAETKTAPLDAPVPVYILYWTANPLREGDAIEYLADIYDRDGAILNALDTPFPPIP